MKIEVLAIHTRIKKENQQTHTFEHWNMLKHTQIRVRISLMYYDSISGKNNCSALRFCQYHQVILHMNIQAEKGNKSLKTNSICHVRHKHAEEGKKKKRRKKINIFKGIFLQSAC